MKTMVIISSVREGRAADKVTAWALKALKKEEDMDIDVADLKDIPLPLFNSAIHPAIAKGQYDNPVATEWATRVTEADSFIFIVAEYNHGYTAAIKNALDWVAQGWWYKPVSFISYGGISGGTRAVQQLKQVVLELRMFPLHDAVYIPFVSQAFDEHGKPVRESMDDNLAALIQEHLSMTKKLSKQFAPATA